MKKKFMNIRPQEVTENGERSVQYKGSDGKMHGIAPAGNSGDTAQSNIVLEVNFADDGKAFTESELIDYLTQFMSGKCIICISDNNWGTQNERRVALVTRAKGFEVVDGSIVIGNSLTFQLASPSAFGDLDEVMFLKQQDGSFELSHYFNK